MISIDFFLKQLDERVGNINFHIDAQGHYQLMIDGIDTEIFAQQGELFIQGTVTKLEEDPVSRQAKISRCLALMLIQDAFPGLVLYRDSERGTLNLYSKMRLHCLQYDAFEFALEKMINCVEYFKNNVSDSHATVFGESFMHIVKP